ncbi:unnamed protein product [Closterium sp. Naga37s-1]|nr:unnamed protein product [Closterium sp. Naga37s-1]
MGMALYRRAVLAASFRRPSAIRAAAARLSSSARLAPTARAGILLPSLRRFPAHTSRAALLCSPSAASARHLDLPSSARSFRASLCAPRALAGIGGSERQLLASARSGDGGAGIGAIRGVSISAGSGAADAQLRTAEGKDGGTEAVRASASGGAEGGKEGRGKARAGKKSRSSYGAEHIQVLEGLEPVRRRPGMYIGSTGPRGLHHLVYEVVDNAIDEAQAGHASTVAVLLGADGSVCVTDNGRGIPTDIHPSTGKSALETVLTVLHAGGKFGGDSSGYRVSGGLHGVGVSVVNALSQWLEARVWRDGRQYSQRFERGVPVGGMRVEEGGGAGAHEGEAQRTGTQIHFLPDPTGAAATAVHPSLNHHHHLSRQHSTFPLVHRLAQLLSSPPQGTQCSFKHVTTIAAIDIPRSHPQPNFHAPCPSHSARPSARPAVFTTTTALDFTTIAARLRELAFLNPQARPPFVPLCRLFPVSPPLPPLTRLPSRLCLSYTSLALTSNPLTSRAAILPHANSELPLCSVAVPACSSLVPPHTPSFLPPLSTMPPPTQVVIHLKEEGGRSADFHFAGGLLEFVRWLNSEKTPMHEAQWVEEERDGVGVAVAWQWSGDAYSDSVVGYANSIRTSDGGTHLDGAKAAFTRTLNAAARKQRLLKEKEENLAGEHLREGLTCVVAVKVANPEFEGQTKTRLGNPGVRKVVDGVVSDALAAFLDANPAACEAILSKALDAYKAAEAAKKARELVRRKSVLKSAMLPGKLADCSCEDPAKSEVFIVEGDSAGGSTKQGRDRRLQAVLPLRGKILNVERKDDAAIYKNQELQNLILGLGLGLRGEEFDQKVLRYHRIILLTDADVDGAHIRTLLLTFLFRYQRALFENGHVYVGVPPLYKVEVGRQAPVYCYSEAELQAHLRSLPPSASPTIQRFKGLGEMMPTQLWETTLDPSQRRLKLITVDEAAQASVTLSVLMGDKVGPRKELIQTVGSRMAAAGMLDI